MIPSSAKVIPSVAMNDGRWSLTVTRPLIHPIAAQTASVRTMLTGNGTPALSKCSTRKGERTYTSPTDRSISPRMRIGTSARAKKAIGAMKLASALALPPVRKFGDWRVKNAIMMSATTAITSSCKYRSTKRRKAEAGTRRVSRPSAPRDSGLTSMAWSLPATGDWGLAAASASPGSSLTLRSGRIRLTGTCREGIRWAISELRRPGCRSLGSDGSKRSVPAATVRAFDRSRSRVNQSRGLAVLDARRRSEHHRRGVGAFPAVLAFDVVGDVLAVDVLEAGVEIYRRDEPAGDVVEEQLVDAHGTL